jgi:hypothetical protein
VLSNTCTMVNDIIIGTMNLKEQRVVDSFRVPIECVKLNGYEF